MDRVKMVNLKKVKGSSLVETLIATVVIMIVFGIAMLTTSNVLENTVKSSTNEIDSELNKLVYLYQHNKLIIPDAKDFNQWNIRMKKEKEGTLSYIVFRAENQQNKKIRTKRILENK